MKQKRGRLGLRARPATLGVVSFLNSRPLVCGLEESEEVSLRFAVPADLPGMLRRGDVDVALIPVVDLARADGAFKVISDCCIGSDGRTLTVRVFSRVRPGDMTRLCVDGDSHTSVVLSQLIWRELHGKRLTVQRRYSAYPAQQTEAVMLIGDKVVTQAPSGFPYEVDLGEAWRSLTGLPFVFAVWAGRAADDMESLSPLLSQARDRGVADAAQIAAVQGPALGWPENLARTYLVDYLRFRLDDRMRQGMDLFLQLADRHGYLRTRRYSRSKRGVGAT